MLNRVELSEDEEDVSYGTVPLFTNIPINETIDFICDEIYIHKKLQPICKPSIFKKLLLKLTTECRFSINDQLCKQIHRVSMGGTLSVVVSDCFMNKMEKDVVIPFKPTFYKWFVDHIYRQRKRNEPDELFDKMNSYHPNIKLTIEISSKKFLDTKILRTSNQIQCFMYHKENKKLIHWNSAVPKSYKQNVIIGDAHRAKKISCDFDYEISVIESKYIKTGYPPKFVTSLINTCPVEKEEPVIPPQMFDETKTVYFQ